MAILKITPQSIVLPGDSPVLRHPPGDVPDELVNAGFEGFDRWTLVNDVFLSPRGRLLAVAPPLLNLEDLGPITVRTEPNGSSVAPRRIIERRERTVLDFGRGFARTLPNECTVHWKTGEQRVEVRRHPVPVDRGEVTLVTLQKDNEPAWVRQWVEYHGALGVRDIWVYDNGSTNREALVRELESVDAPVHVTLVNWPFPYGPRSWKKVGYARRTSIEHWLRATGGNRWYLGTDVDEYVVLGNAVPDIPTLLGGLGRTVGMAALGHYGVPAWRPETPPGEVATAADFPFRLAEPSGDASQKYFSRAHPAFDLGVHNAKVRPLRTIKLPLDLAYFNHYAGLNTGWKGDQRNVEKHEETRPLAMDRSVGRVFEQSRIQRR